MAYKIPILPFETDLETKAVLKKVASARSALAELKGAATSIPNETILINTLSLQEAKDSSAIENIITTHDELYQSDAIAKKFKSVAAKEVQSYALALRNGFETVKKQGFISNNHILQIQSMIEDNGAGFRRLPGTSLKNDQTGEIVYNPPQSYDEIVELMSNLEIFMNDDALSDLDPLVKMAIIHHQFESIFKHPYTKIDFVMTDLGVSRITATRYLDELSQIGMLNKQKFGRDSYYVNTDLYNLLGNVNKKT